MFTEPKNADFKCTQLRLNCLNNFNCIADVKSTQEETKIHNVIETDGESLSSKACCTRRPMVGTVSAGEGDPWFDSEKGQFGKRF